MSTAAISGPKPTSAAIPFELIVEAAPSQAVASGRVVGLDVARCIAIFGMVIVNYKNALRAYNGAPYWITKLFDCVDGRAAVTFVTLAGMGAILLSQSARASNDSVKQIVARKRLFYRSLFVLALGIGFFQLWPGDILHFYGLYMLTGAILLYARPWRLLVFAAAAVLAVRIVPNIFHPQGGYGPDNIWYLDFLTPRGFLRNEFVNGYHPYFPWVAYYLAGMWLAQKGVYSSERRKLFLVTALVGIVVCEWAQGGWSFAHYPHVVTQSRVLHFFYSCVPMVLRMGSRQCTAVAVVVLASAAAERFASSPIVIKLAATGQMALTHYLGHVIIVLGPFFLLEQLERDHSRWLSLGLAFVYSTGAVFFSSWWKKRYRHGPLEAVMRTIAG